ncbi:MAG: bifunctional phosphoribosylaminoimidazolecarboxamide formyltransferase/IMP cyclohydrolase [Clostridium sp.]|uniref:bifunctional phosphoribosylaminoimidazolecarboxamide formyltransferase/IMP cyclohydrolase n=1 Tax=Clostridium sp. TaxID=1506 RepID=UPI003EE69F17
MKRRALISVFNKDGVLEFSKELINMGVEILSTGGTYKYLKENGIEVIEVNKVTDFPEMLDGRVKTLHPRIHAGILAIRDDEKHMNTLEEHNINTIDYVVVNLYPFFEKVKEDLSFDEKVEFIDIGGPTMLRAAAKNFKDVTVISDTKDYERVINEIKENGEVTLGLKKVLAGKVFNLMSAYDAAISNFLLEGEEEYPEYLSVSYKKKQSLRYGENPHQSAAYYGSLENDGAMNSFEILNGKELSYNNLKDVDIAWKVCNEFTEIACCALKHNTPCGVAIGETVLDSYKKAHDADPVSIFGGIVGINRVVDKETAEEMSKIFLEVIIANGYTEEALEVLKKKKNLRVLEGKVKPNSKKFMVTVDGGILVQEEDLKLKDKMEVVTEKKPSEKELRDMEFGMKVVKYVKSNAIVAVKDGVAVGVGGGQVNRIWATTEALERAKSANVIASDAFFPFRDCVDEIAKYGVKAIIQPGGSMRDEESIKACNEHEISMVFTGIRHFKH